MTMKLPILLRYRVIIYFALALFLSTVIASSANTKTIVSLIKAKWFQEKMEEADITPTDAGQSEAISELFGSEEETYQQAARFDSVEKMKPRVVRLRKVAIWIMIIILFVYNRPVRKVIKKGRDQVDAQTLLKAKRRILNVTSLSMYLCWVYTAGRYFFALGFHRHFDGTITLPTFLFISMIHVFLGIVATTIVLALYEGHVSKFIPCIYTPEELFREKEEGRTLSLNAKIRILVISTSIMPLAIVLYIFLTSDTSIFSDLIAAGYAKDLAALSKLLPRLVSLAFAAVITFFTIIIALIVSSGIRSSLTNPLNNLVTKMNAAGAGDFSNKASVFSNDEIGQLRANYNKMLDGLKQRDFIKDTFGKFMSLEIAKEILEHGKIDLGGEEVEATVLFSDIRNFTSMSEKMSAREVVDFLNDFFSHIVDPILKNNGVVNKYIGDCVMALFGVPNKISDHADMAVLSALGMREALANYNLERRDAGMPPINIGIGIHTGTLISGNIGSCERLEYTVIGDTVNVASRIESQTKELACTILISDTTCSKLSDEVKDRFTLKAFPEIKVKGKEELLTLYTVENTAPQA